MRIIALSLPCLLAGGLLHAAPCERLSTLQEFLTCAQTHHPDSVRAEAQLAGLDAQRAAAGQRPNPDLDAQASVADTDAGSVTRTEASLKHTFELGSKRSGRLGEAAAREELTRAEAARRKELVVSNAVQTLFRLRHNLVERKNIDEALGTFSKIVRQYRSRSHLPPEQAVSLDVFELARADYEARRAALHQERRSLESRLSLMAPVSIEAVERLVSAWEPVWPATATLQSAAGKGAAWAQLDAAKRVSQAGMKSARSEAYPNLAVGPYLESEAGGSESSTGLGAALSLALPLYQRNRGGVALARREAHIAEVEVAQTTRELEALRLATLDIYGIALRALRAAPLDRDMEKKHHATERLFERGLVSASLIIEEHRQSAEVIEGRNAQELQAAEALWTLYALDGRALKESL